MSKKEERKRIKIGKGIFWCIILYSLFFILYSLFFFPLQMIALK